MWLRIETLIIDAHLEAQYNARAAVPEHLDIQADWQRRSENHFTIVEELAREGVLLERALTLLEQP